MGANYMILRRLIPPLPYLPRYDPPKGQYSPEVIARFVRNSGMHARGFYDAIRTERLRVAIWLCPKCGSENRAKRMDESNQSSNRCGHCKQNSTYNEVLTGTIYKEPPKILPEIAVVRTRHHQNSATICTAYDKKIARRNNH